MWNWGEQRAIAVMTAMNLATVALVETIGLMIATDGWAGSGITSVESWVCWKTNVSRHRAEGLCRIARRAEDLPICWDLFVQGRLTEDAMVRIAGKVPTSRDREVGDLALAMSIAQLTRVLSTLPELDPKPEPGQFLDSQGRPIEPPRQGADPLPPSKPPDQLTFRPPCGERLNPRDFGWN